MNLSSKATAALLDDINRLMFHWHLNERGSDYRCEFCGNTAHTNNAT